ncbi:hypothetical protein [Chelativorans salis]|uniref:Uncharacterized protein n=1 Tax=Chelativorans salis TaxID=2978478 RepID=A0ABT2LQJ6_9HYPH|nr:hypothetical protein [Chelativorans sp. EGI FJ00035]MCT7376825.1 hypothetical protein [Chelativorans sp. EGI FJ00035]
MEFAEFDAQRVRADTPATEEQTFFVSAPSMPGRMTATIPAIR